MKRTKLGTRLVKVKPGKSVVYFSAGEHGEREKGKFAFWTAVFDVKGDRGITGRAPVTRAPGERFCRFEHERRDKKASQETRDAYEQMYQMLGKVEFVRPAKLSEINRWINAHKKDAIFIERAKVGGEDLRMRMYLE